MVVSSRFVKKVFTGKLDSKVSLFGFHMTEAEYLKCQVLRILTECRLTLGGLFEYEEEARAIRRVEGRPQLP